MGDESKEQEQTVALQKKSEELTQLIEKRVYLNSTSYSYYFRKWHAQTLYMLQSLFGEKSKEITRFEAAAKLPTGRATEREWAHSRQTAMVRTAAELEAILSTPRKVGESKERQQGISPEASVDLNRIIQSLHPQIAKVSADLFKDRYYSEAIFAAFKAVNNYVKQKSHLKLDGQALMAQAFNEDDPAIRLNKGSGQSDRDEQKGFRFLYMGAMCGIRNPKAHETIKLTDPDRTLEYLSFASLLMRRAEEGKIARRGK